MPERTLGRALLQSKAVPAIHVSRVEPLTSAAVEPSTPDIAMAVDGVLDPRALGAAWQSGPYDDQDLKRVWHLPAGFGRSPTGSMRR